jgi:hypothetical protein
LEGDIAGDGEGETPTEEVAELTTAVAADVAAVDPLRFVAVTMTRKVAPESAAERP